MTVQEYIAKFDPDFLGNQTVLGTVLTAAQAAVEAYIGRGLGLVTNRLEDARGCRHAILLKYYPTTAVEWVHDRNGNALEHDADLEKGIVFVRNGDPEKMTVKYSGGLQTVPADIELAMALVVGAMMSSLETGGKQIASERLGDWQQTYAVSGATVSPNGANVVQTISTLSPAAAALLNIYCERRA